MQTRYIEIQSQTITDAFRTILIDVSMLIGKTKTAKIRFSFGELYFAYPRILKAQQEQNGGAEKREHLDILVAVVRALLSDSLGG